MKRMGRTPVWQMPAPRKYLPVLWRWKVHRGMVHVQVSQNAVSQSEVKLGLEKREQYYLEDLLYSLMLKSHNDTAVAIAEHCGGTVEGFARMLNRKAKTDRM